MLKCAEYVDVVLYHGSVGGVGGGEEVLSGLRYILNRPLPFWVRDRIIPDCDLCGRKAVGQRRRYKREPKRGGRFGGVGGARENWWVWSRRVGEKREKLGGGGCRRDVESSDRGGFGGSSKRSIGAVHTHAKLHM